MSDQQYEQDLPETDGGYATGESAGSLLRAAREARGESIPDVAHALKLAPRQVEAMELDRFDLLPGPAFVRGFLRNYARYLGVDVEFMLSALSSEVVRQKVDLAPVTNATGAMPDGNGEQRVLKPVVIVILGLLLALGMGWYFDWFRLAERAPVVSRSEIGPLHDTPMPPELLADKPAAQEPGREDAHGGVDTQSRTVALEDGPEREVVPLTEVDSTAPVVGVEVKPEAVASAATIGVTAAPALHESAPPSAPVAATPVATEPAAAESAAAESAATESAATESAATLGATPSEASVADNTLPAGLSRLVFKLDGESWIQVRDVDDVTLFSGVVAAGTTRTVQGKPPFSLVVGNAAKVVLEHDGKVVDLVPHTRSGGVARVKLEQAGQ